MIALITQGFSHLIASRLIENTLFDGNRSNGIVIKQSIAQANGTAEHAVMQIRKERSFGRLKLLDQ
jgi:hypothetical protein